VNNDSVEIWNSGLLPDGLSVEMLYKQHSSLPRNRSLANLFFKAGYIESWGRGTIAIAEECKANGLPSPLFYEQSGGFTAAFLLSNPTGNAVTPQVTLQVTPQVTPQVKLLVNVLTGEMTRDELQNATGIKDREYFRKEFLKASIASGLVEMTIPDKPNSKNQKYRLTIKGNELQK
jgi:ATP-dependent DNA helicase RecG